MKGCPVKSQHMTCVMRCQLCKEIEKNSLGREKVISSSLLKTFLILAL